MRASASTFSNRLNQLTGRQFEQLCRDLLVATGFTELDWLKGGSDEGRDLEGTIENQGLKWFFECKRYSRGIAVKDIADKVAWAEAEKADVLVILSNSHLTPSAKRWLKKRNDQRVSVLNWTDSVFELLCYSFPDVLAKHLSPLTTPESLCSGSFINEVLAPFLIARGGFETFVDFPFSTSAILQDAQIAVEREFAQMSHGLTEVSAELTEKLAQRMRASRNVLEALLQETEPAGADYQYLFSPEVRRRMLKRFCTEEAAAAFFRQNLWIDCYVCHRRRVAEKQLVANLYHEALDTLSSLFVHINDKSRVPFKTVRGRSSSSSTFRIPRKHEDDRLLDDIMEFERSIALALFETGNIKIDTYEGWQVVEAAVGVVIRRAFKRFRSEQATHDEFIRAVTDAFWQAFRASGLFQRTADADRAVLWNLIKAFFAGIAISGAAYSMWRMFTTMDPNAQQMAYNRISGAVDVHGKIEIDAFRRLLSSEAGDSQRIYDFFYSYIFHYVYNLDPWHDHYY
jgi:hypothetical protein